MADKTTIGNLVNAWIEVRKIMPELDEDTFPPDNDGTPYDDTDKDPIAPFVNSANLFAAKVIGGKYDDDDAFKDIVYWLSAHLISFANDRPAIRNSADPVEIRYSDIFSSGLNSTPYGQTAIMLDTTGTLATYGDEESGGGVIFKAVPGP